MCGRYYFSDTANDDFIEISENLKKRNISIKIGEVFPGDTVAVVANNRDCHPRPFAMNWGYRRTDGKLVFNARSETAMQSPMFADGMRQRRCLIPATVYYEWGNTFRGKERYSIEPRENKGFYFAGIYRIQNGIPECSILTKEPVISLQHIHNRMPVILPETQLENWLNPYRNSNDILYAAVSDMVFHPWSELEVNNPRLKSRA